MRMEYSDRTSETIQDLINIIDKALRKNPTVKELDDAISALQMLRLQVRSLEENNEIAQSYMDNHI